MMFDKAAYLVGRFPLPRDYIGDYSLQKVRGRSTSLGNHGGYWGEIRRLALGMYG